jgi:hypothetical protein
VVVEAPVRGDLVPLERFQHALRALQIYQLYGKEEICRRQYRTEIHYRSLLRQEEHGTRKTTRIAQ